MANLLYLAHRLPFPPDPGDPARAYHLLKHLAARHRVFLGTFVESPGDEAAIEAVRTMCPDLHVARIRPRLARMGSLSALFGQQAVSLRYYRNAHLQAWVDQTLAQHQMEATVISSSVMAQYVPAGSGVTTSPMLVDFVDLDSAKWIRHAAGHRWPRSWWYRREGARLRDFERSVAVRSERSFFGTESEAALFQKMAPECGEAIVAMNNGVDTDYFSPDPVRPTPFAGQLAQPGQLPVVFTSAMDYWPNVDAVTWFARDVLPRLRRSWPAVRFYIVGGRPPPAVLALASDSVVVTGTVPDIRPYLQHAALVVAPLRVAHGRHREILEAMALGKPVVASQTCTQAIEARQDELVRARGVSGFVREMDALLKAPARAAALGQAARLRVLERYSWTAHLGGIDRYLDARSQAREGL